MAMNHPSGEDGQVAACPKCDTAGQVHERACRGNAYVGDPDDPYVCYDCKSSFAEPVYRPPKENSPARGSGNVPLRVSESLLERVRQATDPPEAL